MSEKQMRRREYMCCMGCSVAFVVKALTEKGLDLKECYLEISSGYPSIMVWGQTQETDQEFADRLVRERNVAKREEERERDILAYLKQKYEGAK